MNNHHKNKQTYQAAKLFRVQNKSRQIPKKQDLESVESLPEQSKYLKIRLFWIISDFCEKAPKLIQDEQNEC